VVRGDIIEVWANSVPSGGIGGKLYMIVEVDDSGNHVYIPLSSFVAQFYYGCFARPITTLESSTVLGDLAALWDNPYGFIIYLQTLAATLFTSSEYVARARTNTQFVNDLYSAILGRQGDTAGVASYVATLTGGATRASVVSNFAQSDELVRLRIPSTRPNIVINADASSLRAKLIALASPLNGAVLVYNSSSGQWEPGTAGLTNPMTTAGDIIVGGASGAATRAAKGANNTVWGVNGAGVVGYKADPVASSGGVEPFLTLHPDIPPSSANALDDEFTGSGLNTSKWSWMNQGSGLQQASANQGNSHLNMVAPIGAGYSNHRILYQAVPSGAFKVRCKVALIVDRQNGNAQAGLYVSDGTNIIFVCIMQGTGGTTQTLSVTGLTDVNNSGTATNYAIANNIALAGRAYFEIEHDATNRYFRVSPTGAAGSFLTLYSQDKTLVLTPTRIGIGVNAGQSSIIGSFDWFRRIT
jgi:hypothetical protein